MTLTAGRIALILAFILLIVASLGAFGVLHVAESGFALAGLAFWALSGALD